MWAWMWLPECLLLPISPFQPPSLTARLLQRLTRGLHEGRVEGAGDGQRHRLERALGSRLALHLIQRGLVACTRGCIHEQRC